MNKYTSTFPAHIPGLIREKHAIGYNDQTEAAMLKRFDVFCNTHYPDARVLDREIVIRWSKQHPGEHSSSLRERVTPVRELVKYINSNEQWAMGNVLLYSLGECCLKDLLICLIFIVMTG
jgi:hypothetical protein